MQQRSRNITLLLMFLLTSTVDAQTEKSSSLLHESETETVNNEVVCPEQWSEVDDDDSTEDKSVRWPETRASLLQMEKGVHSGHLDASNGLANSIKNTTVQALNTTVATMEKDQITFRNSNNSDVALRDAIHRISNETESTRNDTLSVNSFQQLNSSNILIYSDPLCYSHIGLPVIRRCSSRGWVPAAPPTCFPQQPSDNRYSCPPPFEPVPGTRGALCLMLDVTPRRWRPLCLRAGAADSLLDVEEELREAALEEIARRGAEASWLPARRAQRFGPLLRRLPGRRWLDPFPDVDRHKFSLDHWDLREDCLSINTTDGRLSTAPCDKHLPTACVALAGGERRLADFACPEGFTASRHAHTGRLVDDPWSDNAPNGGFLHCFRALHGRMQLSFEDAMKNHECPQTSRVPLTRELVHYIVPKLVNKLSMDDEEYCWTNFKFSDPEKDIRLETVSNVSGELSSPPDYAVNVVSKLGNVTRLISSYSLLCTICETEMSVPEVEMSLKRDPRRSRLLLSVYGASGLWVENRKHYGFRCFTNARGGYDREIDVKRIWKRRWTVDRMEDFFASSESGRRPVLDLDVEKTLFMLKHEKDSAGHYWCEGHTIGSFKLIKSNIVLVRGKTKGHVYSLRVDVKNACDFNSTSCDPTFHENFKEIEKGVKKKLPSKFTSDLRFMGIENVTQDRTVSITLHVVPNFNLPNLANDFKKVREILNVHLDDNQFQFKSLLSTEGCVPLEDNSTSTNLQWDFTPLGAVGVSVRLCLQDDGLPVSRPCTGDFISGGMWGSVSGNCSQKTVSPITTSLHSISSHNVVGGEGHSIASNVSSLTSDPDALIPADIYYTAQTMRNLARSGAYSNNMTKPDATSELTAVSQIVNHISLASDKVVSLSQRKLNSSNMLLDAVDVLFDRISSRIEDMESEDGVLLAVTPFVLIQVCDIRKTNVTGLALIRQDVEDSGEPPTDFTKYEVIELDSSKRLETVLEYSGLEVAVWAPQNLVDYIFNTTGNGTWYDPQPNITDTSNSTTNNFETVTSTVATAAQTRIVTVLFYKDLTFYNATEEVPTEDSENGTSTRNETIRKQTRVGSRIVSITIPGFSQSLPVPIPIVFRPLVEQAKSRECAYWDFAYNSSSPSQSRGGWSSEGCVYAGNSTLDPSTGQLDVCLCTHLTHFAELLGSRYRQLYLSEEIRYEDIVAQVGHNKALDVITLMGCCLSLFGIIAIIVTAIVFRSWRQKPGSKILLQLSTALAFQIILLMVSGTLTTVENEQHCLVKIEQNSTTESNTSTCDHPSDPVCVTLGALLHYFSLAAFTWMFVSALLQFMRYVKILGPTRPPRFFLKSLLFGWGAPLLPVVWLVTIDPDSYVQPDLCYPSGLGLYLAVLIPILIFLTMNLSVFVMVINSIVRGPDGKVRSSPERSLVVSQLKLSVLLFFLLGLSWLFGLLVVSGAGIVFSYLFCIAATLQGFVLFVFFVACDPQTRKLWQSTFGSWSNLLLLRLGPTESNADLTSSVSTIHREPTTETSDTM